MNDQRKTKAQLIEEVEALRAQLAEASPSPDDDLVDRFGSTGFWVVDTDFVVRMVNQTMLDLLGDKGSEIVGKKCYQLLGGPRCHTTDCSLRRVFASGDVGTFAEPRTLRDQIPLQCRVVARMLRDPRRNAIGVIEEITAPVACASAAARAHTVESASQLVDRPPPDALDLLEAVGCLARSLQHAVEHDGPARALAQELVTMCGSFACASQPANSGDETREAGRAVLVVTPPGGTWTDAMALHAREGGYCVATARSPEEAVAAISRQPAIDVAVIDLALRNPESAQVYARLREVRPLLSILVLSSDGGDTLERRRWRRPRTWYMRQPINAETLYTVLTDIAPLPHAAHPDAL